MGKTEKAGLYEQVVQAWYVHPYMTPAEIADVVGDECTVALAKDVGMAVGDRLRTDSSSNVWSMMGIYDKEHVAKAYQIAAQRFHAVARELLRETLIFASGEVGEVGAVPEQLEKAWNDILLAQVDAVMLVNSLRLQRAGDVENGAGGEDGA